MVKGKGLMRDPHLEMYITLKLREVHSVLPILYLAVCEFHMPVFRMRRADPVAFVAYDAVLLDRYPPRCCAPFQSFNWFKTMVSRTSIIADVPLEFIQEGFFLRANTSCRR